MNNNIKKDCLKPVTSIIKKCSVVFVLNCSLSMAKNNNIGKMNNIVGRFISDIKNVPIALSILELTIISYGYNVEIISNFSSIKDIVYKDLTAGGDVPMEKALSQAVTMLKKQRIHYKNNDVLYYRPYLLNISDEISTENYNQLLR